jgi:hypothetical protein
MRVTGFWSLAGAIVMGVILADLVHNATGTTALANAGISSEKVSLNALLGKTS